MLLLLFVIIIIIIIIIGSPGVCTQGLPLAGQALCHPPADVISYYILNLSVMFWSLDLLLCPRN
jgi:hypothetical protein